jgi:hypothetical protein
MKRWTGISEPQMGRKARINSAKPVVSLSNHPRISAEMDNCLLCSPPSNSSQQLAIEL